MTAMVVSMLRARSHEGWGRARDRSKGADMAHRIEPATKRYIHCTPCALGSEEALCVVLSACTTFECMSLLIVFDLGPQGQDFVPCVLEQVPVFVELRPQSRVGCGEFLDE